MTAIDPRTARTLTTHFIVGAVSAEATVAIMHVESPLQAIVVLAASATMIVAGLAAAHERFVRATARRPRPAPTTYRVGAPR